MIGKSAARKVGSMVAKSASGKLGKTGAKAVAGVARTLADPKKTKRLITAGKVIAPVLGPAAIKASEGVRLLADQQRAKKLGVDVDDVARYRGPTGRTKARIDATSRAVSELRDRRTGDGAVTGFVERANLKLADLWTATNAAAPMPAARRRPTIAAVDRELDSLETDLIAQLVRTGV